jgi:hypothetical protein
MFLESHESKMRNNQSTIVVFRCRPVPPLLTPALPPPATLLVPQEMAATTVAIAVWISGRLIHTPEAWTVLFIIIIMIFFSVVIVIILIIIIHDVIVEVTSGRRLDRGRRLNEASS